MQSCTWCVTSPSLAELLHHIIHPTTVRRVSKRAVGGRGCGSPGQCPHSFRVLIRLHSRHWYNCLSLSNVDLGFSGQPPALQTETKKAFSNSAYCVSSVTMTSTSFISGPTLPLVLVLSAVYLKKPFLCFLTSLATFFSEEALAFLVASLHPLTTVLHSSQVASLSFRHP